jgi:hypothetical protein
MNENLVKRLATELEEIKHGRLVQDRAYHRVSPGR